MTCSSPRCRCADPRPTQLRPGPGRRTTPGPLLLLTNFRVIQLSRRFEGTGILYARSIPGNFVRPSPGWNPLRRYLMLIAAAAVASALLGCLAVESVGPAGGGGNPGGEPPGSVAVVHVSPASGTIPVGQTQQFTATPQDSAGNPLATLSVTWASSNPGVATVNGNTHTLLIRGAGMPYYLVDFTRGVGFTNYRQVSGLDLRDIAFTFSSVPGRERIAYAIDQRTGLLHRYNTATMQIEDNGVFPVTLNTAAPRGMTWLHQDKDDGWFVGLGDGSTAFAWNSATALGSDEAGNWIQSDAEVGGNLSRQWSYLTGTGVQPWSSLLLWNQAIGVQRADGSDQRLLLHHYSVGITYWDSPWGTPSPDGKVVIFNSNMNGSGRYDLFVAEVPLRQ